MDRRRFLKLIPGSVAVALASPALPASPRNPDRSVTKDSQLIAEYLFPLAGFQYYDGQKIWDLLWEGAPLTLRREPGNRYDGNAIEVFWLDHKLGYVAARSNAELAALLDEGQPLHAEINRLQTGGSLWSRVELRIERDFSRPYSAWQADTAD